SLNDKQKMIYAPMSDVGGIMFDKDVVYINVPDKQSFTRNEDGEEEDEDVGVGERLVMRLQEARNGLGALDKGLRLFSGGEEVKDIGFNGAEHVSEGSDDEGAEDEEEDDYDESDRKST